MFLIALCLSILLEAVTRFIDPPEVGNPKLILIVGSLGLASNLVGFLVLGGHGHSHGHEDEHEGHVHEHDEIDAAEEGRAAINIDAREVTGGVHDEPPLITQVNRETSRSRSDTLERRQSRLSTQSGEAHRRRTSSLRRNRLSNIEDMSIHPASFRQDIIAASRPQLESSSSDSEDPATETEPNEETPLIKDGTPGRKTAGGEYGPSCTRRQRRRDSGLHRHHNHNKPKKSGKSHGHSHGDMGMNGMILHVLGDALGNVGVIITALIIWLTDWPGRFYADPAVSLFITLIILRSALPLTFATSKILLQATPDHIDVPDLRKDIENLPGVVSCHHVHIWQLSDTKIVASMHIQVAFPISAEGGERYMELARAARQCLHAYGIHSATIQPEFCLDEDHDHGLAATLRPDDIAADVCLLECVDDCVGQGCCSRTEVQAASSSHSAHSDPETHY